MEFVGTFLDKDAGVPLYLQLYQYLVQAIRTGAIRPGERLPSKRAAASQLGVSVNTVDTAYGMLAAEGYLNAKPRSGFIVDRLDLLLPEATGATADGLTDKGAVKIPEARTAGATAAEDDGKGRDEKTVCSGWQENAQTDAHYFSSHGQPWQYNLSSAGLDTGLFPIKLYNRLFREVLAEGPPLFERGGPLGEPNLRAGIADYLRGYRGVRCNMEQVVVGAGLEVLTGMLLRLFPRGILGVENPGYPKAAHVAMNEGLCIAPIEVDDAGMNTDVLAVSGASIAYLTPSHQFPTGAVMPVGRRAELLAWAAEENHLVIEDDYDSEFRFDGRPLPCMQGLDTANRVVYAGTFSRSLAPGLRAAYLVLPPALVDLWKRVYGDYACTVSRPEQQTLAQLLAGGHFSRTINRARRAYQARRDALLAALKDHMPENCFQVHNKHTGLYFVLALGGLDAAALAQQGRKEGLRLRAVSEYINGHVDASRWNDRLVVGYGALHTEEARGAASALAQLLEKHNAF